MNFLQQLLNVDSDKELCGAAGLKKFVDRANRTEMLPSRYLFLIENVRDCWMKESSVKFVESS